MNHYKNYTVWHRHFNEGVWRETPHMLRARTDAEAQRKVARMFSGAGLFNCSLVAVLTGSAP